MEKMLVLKDSDEHVIGEIYTFSYNAKRMGGAPTISATFYSFDENTVGRDCYVEFNGEKYYINQTPTSSKKNDEARYKYDLEFLSERYTLDNIYFCDSSFGSVSNTTEFLFGGTVRDLADKIQLSIDSSYGVDGNGYRIVVDAGVDDDNQDWKSIEFKNVSVMSAIQEFYNTFKQQFYYYSYEDFDGNYIREFHVGEPLVNNIKEPFKYGADESLLSITRTNANYKAINKITGVGSSENIPYYYPNETPYGSIDFIADEEFGDVSVNYSRLSKHIDLGDSNKLTFHQVEKRDWTQVIEYGEYNYSFKKTSSLNFTDTVDTDIVWYDQQGSGLYEGHVYVIVEPSEGYNNSLIRPSYALSIVGADISAKLVEDELSLYASYACEVKDMGDGTYRLSKITNDQASVSFLITFKVKNPTLSNSTPHLGGRYSINISFGLYHDIVSSGDYFETETGDKLIASESGITAQTYADGGVIQFSSSKNYIAPQKRLMPPIYKATYGNERFYKASNTLQIVEGVAPDKIEGSDVTYRYEYLFGGSNGDSLILPNEYIEGRQVEHILEVDDIKPTIKGVTNIVNGERLNIDSFADFAYDNDDNDDFDDNENYKHPYFFAKLKPLGFNLFDCANEYGEMTISMTSGPCAPCNFVIAVDEKTSQNVVAVDDQGNIVRENGNVVLDRTRAKQDTTSEYVWIALRKDKETYDLIYPNATNDIRPSTDDTFVIININLPSEYIRAAEMRLEEEIKTYLRQNNTEKFNFSIKFSRIYLAEHEGVRSVLNENSKISLEYFCDVYRDLYVSSYTYKMNESETLPEITVELSDSLSTNKGVLQNIASQVRLEVLSSIESSYSSQNARALRKDQNDQTPHRLTAREVVVTSSATINSDAHVGGRLDVKNKASFGDAVSVNGELVIGDYTNVLGEINGARVDGSGNATFNSITANILEVFTLIYNQVRSTSAYTSFDDSGTIIDIQHLTDDYGNEYFKITFEEDKSSYNHHFEDGDILFGYVNQLNNFGYSRAGKCWLNVTQAEIEDEPWSLYAVMFPEDECEDGQNIPPTANMVVMHKGNNAARLNDDGTVTYWNKERQRTFYISSKDGCLVQLLDVTSPKLYTLMSSSNPDNYSNYGVVLGKLPDDLFKYINKYYSFVQSEDPVVYAKYLVVQNLLQIDYAGRPIKTARYRGYWSELIAKGLLVNDGEDKYNNTSTIYDTVTHNGSMWMCQIHETEAEPQDNIYDWKKIVTKGADSAVSNYDILPSVSAIYFDADKNRMSVDKVDVVIGEANAYGYARINDQEILDDKGLTVLYSIDNGALVPFSISDSGALALEDGSGVIALEGGGGIWLEGSDIDSSLINNDITLYLVRDYGLDTETIISLYVIPVVKAGSFKSTVFRRSGTPLGAKDTPTGGTYANPIPEGGEWSDGIPKGVEPIYSSYATFYGNGKNSGWSTPVKMEDTVDFEVMYSPVAFASVSEAKKALIFEETPFNKVGEDIDKEWLEKANENGWYDDDRFADDSQFKVVWMATNHKRVGSEWSDYGWVVTKTEGEKGDKGDKGEDAIATEYNIIKNSAFDDFESFRDGGVTKYNIPDWDTSVLSNSNYSANAVNGQPSILIYGSLSQGIPSLVGGKEYVLSFWYKAGISSNPTVIIVSSSLPEGSVMPLGETTGSTISYNSNVCTINLPVVSDYTKAVFKIKSTSYGSGFSIIWDTDTTGGPSSSMYLSQPKLEMGSVATQYSKAVSELVGPAGEAGPMAYPEGEWNPEIEYRRNEDSVPIVYYDDDTSDEVEGTYYILKTDSVKSDTPPSQDLTNWRPMTKWEFVYINFLMANWALFGGANGGVFYNGHLFSQDGVDSNGASKYGKHKSDMWNGDALSGAFQPNLFLDFFRGVVKSNKLSETFMEFDYNKFYNILNMDESYNVSITPTKDSYNENIGRLLSMPLVNNIYNGDEIIVSKAPWQPDGMKSTILVRESDSWNKVVQLAEGGNYGNYSGHNVSEYDFKNCLTSGVVLCADSRVINQYSYRLYNTSNDVIFNPGQYNENGEPLDTAQYGGFFVVKGRLSKFLFVEPGMMVRLRSCSTSLGIGGSSTDTNKLKLWYVENSDDFEEIPATVTVYISHFYENGKMNKVSDNFDIYDDIGKPFGYGYYNAGTQGTGISFKNYSFATRGIATVDKLMREKEPLVYESNINIYTNKNGHSSLDEEANVTKIQQTEKH